MIYTTGYISKTKEEIRDLIDTLNCLLVDIRFSPYSRNPDFQKYNLQKYFGYNYLWVQEFGNTQYKHQKIEILNYTKGREILADILTSMNCLLLCACPTIKCHRTEVAKLLILDGFEVKEI